MTISPTGEQAQVIEWEGNAAVSARPGSGKTFTMACMITNASEKLLSYQGIIAISYTRKASAELEARCERFGAKKKRSFYGTIDSFCLTEIIAPFAKHLEEASRDIEVVDTCQGYPDIAKLDETWNSRAEDRWDLVKKALQLGVLPVSALSEVAFCMMRHIPGVNHYLSARYTGVYIDEYQDCGLAQHMLVLGLSTLGLTTVAFGDLDQAIFAYDNKSSAYFNELLASKQFKTFEITKNHRCHQSIIEYSLRLMGSTTLHSCSGDQDKRVIQAHIQGDERSIAAWMNLSLNQIKEKYDVDSNNQIALIAKTNKELKLYDSLLSFPCKRFEQTKLDSGFSKTRGFLRGLLAFLYDNNGFPDDFLEQFISPETNPRQFIKARAILQDLMRYKDSVWHKLVCDFQSLACLSIEDPDDISAWSDFGELLANIEELRSGYMPAQSDQINLLTYHKSKGLEFDVVFCLSCYKYLMPEFDYENKPYDSYTQSLNMHYVGITRAKKACYIPTATLRHTWKNKLVAANPSEFLSINGLEKLRKHIRFIQDDTSWID